MIERTEIGGERYYTDGTTYGPSVTTVLKCIGPDLSGWTARVGIKAALEAAVTDGWPAFPTATARQDWVKDQVALYEGEARREGLQHAAVGEMFHNAMWTGDLDTKRLAALPKRFQKMFDVLLYNWEQIVDDLLGGTELVEQEQMVLGECVSGSYGGTIDAIVDRGSATHLWEIKTSRSIAESHAIQAAAYAHALETMPDEVWVLRIDKYSKGKVDFRRVDVKESMRHFEAALQLYNLSKEVWYDIFD